MNKKSNEKQKILDAASKLSQTGHYLRVTREEIALESGLSERVVTYHYGTMKKLRRDIMRHAISAGILSIVSQGIHNGDPYAKRAPEELKRLALL